MKFGQLIEDKLLCPIKDFISKCALRYTNEKFKRELYLLCSERKPMEKDIDNNLF